MKERSARRAAPREGERSQVAEVLNICIVDPSTIWRHTAREILCRELDANGVRACVDEFYAPESMTSDGGCAYYDVVLADISDRQTREQYLRFFRDLRLTSPQTKLILLSADPLAALDVFECDPDYFVCKLEMETRLSAALRFVLRPCGGELGPCLIVGSRATRHVLSMREILYCEHAQRQTKIVMTTRTVTCSEKLNEIYGRLDPAEFVQTHCSFLVNLSYVKELRRTCVVLRSGVTVPLSRANYARVRQALAQHLSHALGASGRFLRCPSADAAAADLARRSVRPLFCEERLCDNRRDVVMVDIDPLVPKDHPLRKIENLKKLATWSRNSSALI